MFFEFFDGTVFGEVTRCGAVAMGAAILGANRFRVMGAVAGVALSGVNCGKRGSNWDSIGARGR